MTVLRNILDDLVEKKLWPIAIALVVALVALPLLFAGGPSPEPEAPVVPTAQAPAATATAAGGAPVSLEADAAVDKRTRKGKVRDPFKQLVKNSEVTDSAATAPGATGGATSTAGTAAPPVSGGKPSPTRISSPDDPVLPTGTKTTPEPTETTPEVAEDDDVSARELIDTFASRARFDTVLRFGRRGTTLRRYDRPRLMTAFPSSNVPLVVISRVRDDGKAVRFRVNPLARVAKGGKCYPTPNRCRTLDLREGSSAIVQVATSPTQVAEYRLEVARIGKTG